ncbi:glycosyl transferase [Sphingobium sp. 22B]|uniref:glycosyltransferase family 4 protein n=1 Tax=unclassified Sphingobium TaxID=2611147 RepID=UPI0007843738|nr:MULTISPECIES: glycosyltransferase family 4 protein [unclassified Sphingobium]KXU32041.1 glycosyl transferase [Sphingobium sp. AM]KYC31795.1 glycosyl transferase [Sphingobium sp. 22B]OAP31319.1 glycosyl transferase [Sphingobium sp. 20006FA]
MKVAMCDPSLFTGRYDDSLCAAMAAEGVDVTLLGRPMRETDAIVPQGYRYEPRFFRRSETLRQRIGEGRVFRLLKAAEYGLSCALGDLAPLARADVAHMQWLPLAPADRIMLRRLKGRTALVHTVHNADAYHADAGVQGRGYRGLLDMFDALIVHGGTTRTALERQGIDPKRIHVTRHPPMRLATAGTEDLAQVPDAVLPRLLFFGTIRPYKGVDLLLQACLSLWSAGHRFELVLAGKPFMDIAPLLDSVHAAGFGERLIADLAFLTEQRLDAHMAKADILVFPYRHIDSSGAFLSALHHGKAMVTSDAGMFAGLPEEVAVRTPAGNAPALAQALLPLVESAAIRQALGARARTYGDSMGNWKDMALATIAIYRSVTGK